MESIDLVERIIELIFNKKGSDVKILNLKNVTTMSDYFIICTADSEPQVRAIADEVEKSLRDDGIKVWHKEGYRALSWVLLDYIDVVVHVFKKDARDFYNLEKLWGDAEITIAEDPALKPKTPAKRKPGRPKKEKSQ